MALRFRGRLALSVALAAFSVALSGAPAAEDKDASEPTPACVACAGLRIVPAKPFAPFVIVDDGKPYKPVSPWSACPRCGAGAAKDGALKELRSSLAAAVKAKGRWEERADAKLTLVATPYLALYTQARPQEVRSYALLTEKLTGHLQMLTGSMTLTRTRPDTDVILLLNDSRSYRHFVDEMVKRQPDEGWENCRRTSGAVDRHLGVSNLVRSGPTADHHVVFLFGQMQMYEATEDRAPPWLREGFAAYCERSVFHRNLYASVAYKENEPRLEPHWPRAMRMALQKGAKVNLGTVVGLDMSSANSTDYLACYSVVSYLLDAHPKEFLKFLLQLRGGELPRKALTTAYGRKIDDLNAEWRRWAMNLGRLRGPR